jgi:dephospho-CoA kinase
MYRIGLTGNIGSGKSSVASCWRTLGAHVVDADELAREAVAPGSDGLRRVVDRFGAAVLSPDGSLDRAALRSLVFADSPARRDLESIVHPEVARLREAAEARHADAGGRIIVHEIPLLFEADLAHGFDAIVVVDAPEEERLHRIVQTRGLEPGVARGMIEAQQPAATKRAQATWVIDNSGSLADLRARAAEVWHAIETEASRCG